jgi:hypothetical protein
VEKEKNLEDLCRKKSHQVDALTADYRFAHVVFNVCIFELVLTLTFLFRKQKEHILKLTDKLVEEKEKGLLQLDLLVHVLVSYIDCSGVFL